MAAVIALSGFMGCGKSSVAMAVAAAAHCFYFDLDDTIEMEEKLEIPEIFAERGEEEFRRLEAQYLKRIMEDYDSFPATVVLSLGGGTVTNPACSALLKGNATTVYLRAGVDEIVNNLLITGIDRRPLLAACTDDTGAIDKTALAAKVTALLEKRKETYEKTADIIIDIDGLSPEQIAERILLKAV